MNNHYPLILCPALCVTLLLLLAPGGAQPLSITSLMPGNAVDVIGQYNTAGSLGLGFASGKLPFTNSCVNEVTEFPGSISYDIRHFGGELAENFRRQIGAEEKQRLLNEKANLESRYDDFKDGGPDIVRVDPVRTETVKGGSIMYFSYSVKCYNGRDSAKPETFLFCAGHTDNTAITVKVEGEIDAEAAKAAALEVMSNFAKTDFSRMKQ